ncbi:class I SAM-dependent methyltransferase [Roseomonas sp. CCTCC AB2023176]|uniref:class I SAM-dependent methyltransferase n=1 Tax=Roseomonas sp. CCTCC AB2023176 TaxID=3342640 RepID=UPI0035DD7A3D
MGEAVESSVRPAARTARYGVDAPAVMLGLAGGGAVGVAAGVAALAGGSGGFAAAGAVVGSAALVPLGLGLGMAAYAVAGKRRLRDALLARVPWRGDEVVLDVGAGRGLMAVGAAKRVPRGRVIALDAWRAEDLSGNGPDGLQGNAEIEGVSDRISVVTGDAREMDLPDAGVDVVLSVLCLHNIEPAEDRSRACREIARVLRPGGRAVIADYRGTSGYARDFAAAGLVVRRHETAYGTALSLMSVVEAEKPA